jgi:hypothetical protein
VKFVLDIINKKGMTSCLFIFSNYSFFVRYIPVVDLQGLLVCSVN